LYLDGLCRRQQAEVGASRFWLVPYEEFCAAPAVLVRRVAAEVLGDETLVLAALPRAFPISSAPRVSGEIAAEIAAELSALGAGSKSG
jgi:hypothetical protein